jgi:hypothetical protein
MKGVKMQQEITYYEWDIKKGDYKRDGDYDSLYFKNKKRDVMVRKALWFGVAVVASQVFFIVLVYASKI